MDHPDRTNQQPIAKVATTNSTDEDKLELPCYTTDEQFHLGEHLRSRLIECGWRDQVASQCRALIHKHGVENIRLEQIISEVRPTAKQQVPDTVKMELLEMVRKLNKSVPLHQSPRLNIRPNDSSQVWRDKGC